MVEIKNINSLTELLTAMRDQTLDPNEVDFSELPTFGGITPKDTVECWSWDQDNVLVGACSDDYHIISRSEWQTRMAEYRQENGLD